MRYILLVTTLCFMVACNATTPPVAPNATAAPPTAAAETVNPTATAALASDTPATVAPEIEATAAVTATEVATPTQAAESGATEIATGLCDEPVYEAFQAAWEANGATGCPTSETEVGTGAIQPFTNGAMVWTSESDEGPAYIYVLVNDGTWQRFEDEWEEGDVENANLTPPAGALEPKRGFGLVWRDQLGGPDATIGWGLVEEAAQETAVQSFGDDTAISANGIVYWLSGDGTWQ